MRSVSVRYLMFLACLAAELSFGSLLTVRAQHASAPDRLLGSAASPADNRVSDQVVHGRR
jgi:hypothetical protein